MYNTKVTRHKRQCKNAVTVVRQHKRTVQGTKKTPVSDDLAEKLKRKAPKKSTFSITTRPYKEPKPRKPKGDGKPKSPMPDSPHKEIPFEVEDTRSKAAPEAAKEPEKIGPYQNLETEHGRQQRERAGEHKHAKVNAPHPGVSKLGFPKFTRKEEGTGRPFKADPNDTEAKAKERLGKTYMDTSVDYEGAKFRRNKDSKVPAPAAKPVAAKPFKEPSLAEKMQRAVRINNAKKAKNAPVKQRSQSQKLSDKWAKAIIGKSSDTGLNL